MNCPNCKAVGTLRVYKGSPVYVGCEAPGCHWNQEPLAELVCDAAVATWHRQNPAPIAKMVEEMQAKVYYSIGPCEGWNGTQWVIWKHTFSGKSMADPRRWPRAERQAAEDALAVFVNERAAELGECA